MAADNVSQQNVKTDSYGNILRELGLSAKDLVQNEIHLMTSEIKISAKKVTEHAAQAALFGGLLVLSVFPFLAFLVIGLGEMLDGRYWLSSLIVAVVCAAIGGPLAYKAYIKIRDKDLNFPYTKEALDRGIHTVQRKLDEIKDAAKGERHETAHIH